MIYGTNHQRFHFFLFWDMGSLSKPKVTLDLSPSCLMLWSDELWICTTRSSLPTLGYSETNQWEHVWLTVCTSHRMLQRGGESKLRKTNNLLWLLMITLVLKTGFNTSSRDQGRAGYSEESVQQDQEWHPKSIEAFKRYMYQSIRKNTRRCRILVIFPDRTLQLLGNRKILGEGFGGVRYCN